MPTPGPWISEEPPDYPFPPAYIDSISGADGLLPGEGIAGGEKVQDLDPDLVTAADLELSYSQALAQNTAVGGLGGGGVTHSWEYSLSYPTWTSRWTVTVDKGRRAFAPPEGGIVFSEGVADPENAIGVEYEGHPWNPADPWSADVDVRATEITGTRILGRTDLRADVNDPTSGSGDFPVPFTTSLYVAAPSGSGGVQVADIPGGPSAGFFVRDLGVDIDITDIVGSSGAGQVYVLTPLHATTADPDETDSVEGSHGTVSYGWGIADLRVEWTYRAPRYRWIYDTVPFRRTYPRDDSLAGGSGRTWPPPRSVQSSNRTVGGYL